MSWWHHIPEHINPYIVEIGPLRMRYYGLMYVVAITVTYLLVLYRLKSERYEYSKATIQEYLLWAILGVVVGGRLGFVLFYDLTYSIAHPLRIFSLSGMSYHGGLLGVMLVSLFFCYKKGLDLWLFADFLSPTIPLGYTFGRIGNFLNGELYGRVTSVPWGMYFPLDRTGQLRHPSQLYEAFFEGIFLFVILWGIRKKQYFNGFHFCLYIIGYGIVRFCIEFVREPNPGLGSIWHFFTMGQILCIVMVLGGVFVILTRKQLLKISLEHSGNE